MKIALANPATSLAAPHAVAGGASSVDHEASILTSVRKYQERRGIDWLTPKMLVEQQEEIKEEGIDPMRIEDNSMSVLVEGNDWIQVGLAHNFPRVAFEDSLFTSMLSQSRNERVWPSSFWSQKHTFIIIYPRTYTRIM